MLLPRPRHTGGPTDRHTPERRDRPLPLCWGVISLITIHRTLHYPILLVAVRRYSPLTADRWLPLFRFRGFFLLTAVRRRSPLPAGYRCFRPLGSPLLVLILLTGISVMCLLSGAHPV